MSRPDEVPDLQIDQLVDLFSQSKPLARGTVRQLLDDGLLPDNLCGTSAAWQKGQNLQPWIFKTANLNPKV